MIIIIVIAIAIVTAITVYVIHQKKIARESQIQVTANSFSTGLILNVLSKSGAPINLERTTLIYDNEVVLLYVSEKDKFVLGVIFDKNADKIKQIYGTIDDNLEYVFRKYYKDRLADDFTVKQIIIQEFYDKTEIVIVYVDDDEYTLNTYGQAIIGVYIDKNW